MNGSTDREYDVGIVNTTCYFFDAKDITCHDHYKRRGLGYAL